MGRTIGRFLAVFLAAGAILAATSVESQAYVGVKGGLFMPNDDSKGLKDWDNGYALELFFGGDVGPISLEGGLGGYSTKPDSDADDALNTGYVSGTAKAYLPLGPASLYAGGGLGYYYSKLGDEDTDGNGVGFHAVGGAEFSLGVVSLLAEFKWNQAKIEFEEGADKVNVGGMFFNVGVIF